MTTVQYVDHAGPYLLVEVPLVLPNESNLRGGARSSFAASRRAKAQREAVRWALSVPLKRSGLVERDGGGMLRWERFHLVGPVVVTMTRLAPRSYDDDGTVACFKHVRDEIASLLFLRSDRDPSVSWAYGHDRPLVRGNARVPGVRIEIAPRGDQAA